jgi:hypothetical protein
MMPSLILAVLLSAAPIGPSPATFENTSFAPEDYFENVTDEQLTRGGWSTLTFLSRGVGVLSDGEVTYFTFTATPSDSGYTLVVKDEYGSTRTAHWRWIGKGRAETDLWGRSRIATLSSSPWDRRAAFGNRLAAKELRPGTFRDSHGPVFTLHPDGGVTWARPAEHGVFSTCWFECAEDVQHHLCVRFERPTPEYPFAVDREYAFQPSDGGVIGLPVRVIDPCLARERVAGDALRRE